MGAITDAPIVEWFHHAIREAAGAVVNSLVALPGILPQDEIPTTERGAFCQFRMGPAAALSTQRGSPTPWNPSSSTRITFSLAK